ncbi:MAG: SDR family oxidoreductase [Jiangellaceae bacterium]
MTTYAVTGATGHLGRLVVDALLSRGVPADDIVAIVRTPAKAADLADQGIVVREGDYSRPETLPAALDGVTTLLLISGSEVGRRVPQHTAVVEAAKAAGVARIAYTSVLRADTTELVLAPEHKATEAVIRESGIPFTILRNGPYIENYTSQLDAYLQAGEILGAAGDARVAGATRADFAAAAAAVLTGAAHDGAVYELGGTPFTLSQLAAAITEVTGTTVVYRDVTGPEYVAAATASGLDDGTAGFLGALEAATARGDWYTDRDDLPRLLGHASTALADAIRAAKA